MCMATLLGQYLRHESTLSGFEPELCVIGSVVEGTRIGAGSEIDVSCSLEGLTENVFELGPNAFNLKLSSDGLVLFKTNHWERFIGDNTNFNYIAFLKELLEQLQNGLKSIQVKLPARMTFNLNYSMDQCKTKNEAEQCKHDSSQPNGFHPVKHCVNCMPSITFTKLGPCIITQWKETWASNPHNLTMDLILVFKHLSTSLELFKHSNTTLFEETPFNWRNIFQVNNVKIKHIADIHDIFSSPICNETVCYQRQWTERKRRNRKTSR